MEKSKTQSKLGVSALILLASGLICKLLGAFFRLPLTNLLGIEGIGIFQLIMSLYAFALLVSSGGVANSLSKLIGTARAKGERNKIFAYFKRALAISMGIGLLIGLVFLVFGEKIAGFQRIESGKSYWLFLIMLPLGGAMSAFRGYFQGHENMLPTAISQVLEQGFKFAFGLLFAFYFGKMSVSQGVFGAFLGITLSEFVSLSYLFILFVSREKKQQKIKDMSKLKFAKKEFDRANFPLTLSASILPLVNAFDGLIIIPRLLQAGFTDGFATKLYGLQTGVVGAILNFPLIISMAVTTTLLPNISYLISRGSGGKAVIEKSMKVLLYLILPTTFGMVAISKQVFQLVYNDMTGMILQTAFELMLFGGFSIVFTALMQYMLMLLQANGEFRFVLAITALGGVAKANISFFLSAVPTINIFALILGNVAMSSIVCVLALYKLKHIVEFRILFGELFSVLFATTAMFATVYTFINCDYFSLVWNVFVGVFLGIVAYVVFTLPFILKNFSFKKSKLVHKN